MTIYFSAANRGFYDSAIHGAVMPADVIEIPADEYEALLVAQSEGSTIQADANGYPVAVAPTPPTLDEIKASLCAKIDATADQARAAVASADPGRLSEYEWAAKEAQAFKDAGYTGTVPVSLAIWVEATGWTAQTACDNILTTAAKWEDFRASVRRRLIGKANVNAAANEAGAQAAADASIAEINGALAQVQA